MTVLAKGETCEAAKGSDADGKHARVWAPASSWGLPGLHIDFVHNAITLVSFFCRFSYSELFIRGGRRSQKCMQRMVEKGEIYLKFTWGGPVKKVEYTGEKLLSAL